MMLADVKNAAARISGHVRHTPVVQVDQALHAVTAADLWLKLECFQVTGSFKARGATNRLLSLPPEAIARGIIAASGGNHGVATARAGHMAGVPTTIYLPENASPAKLKKLAAWGAEMRIVGSVWDEAHAAALEEADRRGAFYFHPFADSEIVAGQGTVALEILDEAGPFDLYLIAIGGGGLIAGMATVIKALNPTAHIIGIEPRGSPTLERSLATGSVVTLPEVTTRVATMACGRTDESIFEIVRLAVERIVLVEDEELAEAARWLWFELGIAADLSGAAAIAALRSGAVTADAGMRVCGLVCGAGPDGLEESKTPATTGRVGTGSMPT
jgi:threonine dehydratase